MANDSFLYVNVVMCKVPRQVQLLCHPLAFYSCEFASVNTALSRTKVDSSKDVKFVI